MQSDDSSSTVAANKGTANENPYKQTSKSMDYKAFKELFNFDENDRDKKELKKDFKKIEKDNKDKVKFKHLIGNIFIVQMTHSLIDYYIGSSEQFTEQMQSIDA